MGFIRNLIRAARGKQPASPPQSDRSSSSKPFSGSLAANLAELRQHFSLTPDLIIRHLLIPSLRSKAALVYLSSLTDQTVIQEHILKPLLHEPELPPGWTIEQLVSLGRVQHAFDLIQIEEAILQGKSVLLLDDAQPPAYLFETQGWPQRAIEDPQLETSLKGAHQGFVETSSQNIALIRRYIPDRELKIIERRVGRRGATLVSILYLADIANPQYIKEMGLRIQNVDVDSILNAGMLEELIEDNPYSPFPQFAITERPDSVASHILQGRIAVVVDLSPGVLIGPASFAMFFQNVDDYSIRWQVSSFLRLLRFAAFFVTVFLPAVYIAVISFNFEVIPLQLLINVGESRADVPFPPILEAFIMEITLEMLREAGVRLPAPIGQTVGIVGAIVIGQATVQAGIVSNIMVIVVSLTALSSFIIPNHDMSAAIRLIRFPMMLIASFFGLLGVSIGMMVLFGHLIALESLGTPYFSPLAPVRFSDWKDTFVRLPLWLMKKRPTSMKPLRSDKQGYNKPERERS